MSLAELARLGGGAPPARAAIGIDLLIRALAVLLVVVQHATLWPVPGGAAAMVVLIGFGLARFRAETLAAGDWRRFFRPLAGVLAPYYLIVAGYALAWGQVPWASVLLIGNFGFADPERHSMLPYLYWFVEAYAQLLAVWAGVFLIPGVRRMAARDPFRLGLLLLGAALAFRFAGPWAWPIGGREIFTLPWVLYLATFGWLAATARSPARRALVLGMACIVMPAMAYDGGNWTGSWVKYLLQVAVIAALLYHPRVALPPRVVRLVLPVAAASYHIYLVHRFVPEVLLAGAEPAMPPGLFALLAVVGGVVAGLAAFAAQRAAIRMMSGRAPGPAARPRAAA